MKDMNIGYVILLLVITSLVGTSMAKAADKKHIAGVFIGATHFDSETDYTLGLEYEFRFSSQWGAGLVYEKTPDAHHDDGVTVTLGSLYFHPNHSLRIGVGAGREKTGGYHPHTQDLYRMSANYDFHFDNLGVAPTIAVDFIDNEQAFVFGVAFSYAF